MNSLKIAVKNATNLTLYLEKKYNVSYYKKESFLSKLLLKKSQLPDIYFHKGLVTKESIALITNSKITIVNSNSQKKELLTGLANELQKKIKVIYPYYFSRNEYDKKIKKEFKHKYSIDKKSRIILFRGTNLSKSGITYLFDTITRMSEKNFVLVIESNSKEIQSLNTLMKKNNVSYPYILFENYANIDELFIASDIFILPTEQKYFSVDILRALNYRNAVFLMETNQASEILDVFSLIQTKSDMSTSFKIDSLLLNKNELKKIQKENELLSLEYSFPVATKNIDKLILESFDI